MAGRDPKAVDQPTGRSSVLTESSYLLLIGESTENLVS